MQAAFAMDDLSDYERIRLDNIRRNQLFLQSLGLGEVKVCIMHPFSLQYM